MAAYKDFTFTTSRNGETIEALGIEYSFRPSDKTIKTDLKEIKNRFKEGSVYHSFEPKIGILYPSIYGWTTGFNVYLTADKDCEHINRPFFDEPTCVYARKGRKIINF